MINLNPLFFGLRYAFRCRHLYFWQLVFWGYEWVYPVPDTMEDVTTAIIRLRSRINQMRLHGWRYTWSVRQLHRLIDLQNAMIDRIQEDQRRDRALER